MSVFDSANAEKGSVVLNSTRTIGSQKAAQSLTLAAILDGSEGKQFFAGSMIFLTSLAMSSRTPLGN